MKTHTVRAHRSIEILPREEQLAWKLAEAAADPVPVDRDVSDMVTNRVIDIAAVASASLKRHSVASAQGQALAHSRSRGATLFGVGPEQAVSPEWAAWANGVAVRELDFHDTFLAADYGHPGDNIPPLVAVAQHLGLDGQALTRGIAAAYEVQVALVKGICLHEHRIDHIAHLGPSVAAGIGAMMDLPVAITFQAVQQALHVTTTTRQSRKGEISSWKAYAPAFAGKMAVEAVDRALRGEASPSPAYEGEDGFIARLLSGFDAEYRIGLPEPGEPKRAILETYTKEYAAEYQSQALIDLAKRLAGAIGDLRKVREIVIHTSQHTHFVIGSGANDPQKMSPVASRETLDHSIMYIFAVALEDCGWHHETSYAQERARRPQTVSLWQKIRTQEDQEWTRRYHAPEVKDRAFGARVVVTLQDGTTCEDEQDLADAHPLGRRPFGRDEYIKKFRDLSGDALDDCQRDGFLALALELPNLDPQQVQSLCFRARTDSLGAADQLGLFERG